MLLPSKRLCRRTLATTESGGNLQSTINHPSTMKDKLTKSERSALAKTLNQTRNILKNEPTVKDKKGRVIVRAGIVRSIGVTREECFS